MLQCKIFYAPVFQAEHVDNQIYPATISLANRRQIIISISMACVPVKFVFILVITPTLWSLFLHFAFTDPFAPLGCVSLFFALYSWSVNVQKGDDPITHAASGLS